MTIFTMFNGKITIVYRRATNTSPKAGFRWFLVSENVAKIPQAHGKPQIPSHAMINSPEVDLPGMPYIYIYHIYISYIYILYNILWHLFFRSWIRHFPSQSRRWLDAIRSALGPVVYKGPPVRLSIGPESEHQRIKCVWLGDWSRSKTWNMNMNLYVYIYICMSVCLSVSLSVCLSVSLSVCLYVCMYV